MVHFVQVLPVLPGVIKTFCSDLRELTATNKPRRFERIGWRYIAMPVRVCRLIACERLPVKEKTFIITIPAI